MPIPSTFPKIFRLSVFLSFLGTFALLGGDFERFSWMDTREQIEKSQAERPVFRDADRLAYSVKIDKYTGILLYEFVDGALAAAAYDFEMGSNRRVGIADHARLKAALQQKYGDPVEDHTTWTNSHYRNDQSHFLLALWLGHVSCETVWDTSASRITLAIRRERSGVTASVIYVSKAMAERITGERTLAQLIRRL